MGAMVDSISEKLIERRGEPPMSESAWHPDLFNEIEALMKRSGVTDNQYQVILDQVLSQFACSAGTIHTLGPVSHMLLLRARRNIPDTLLPRIQKIPIGKGLAGLAAERRQPVQVCNLQTDSSGAAQPAAKETGMEGCIAVPILAGDQLMGVLGVAKPTAYEFNNTEIAQLTKISNAIGKFLASNPSDW
jgi:L-methionine (R)-S-oxide reductase